MAKPIIEVQGISKRYQLGAIGATRLRDDVERAWHRLTGKAAKVDAKEFWALRDVSFEVQPGEIVGIIGRNGAGKSTLLKILSRITEPTSGEIVMRGRVASLLEVGTGFHGDLTGRENIFLNGAILGMTKAEIRSKLDEIIAFAEVEKFIDTPVKRYSSGMYVRLAFAVASHLEPEILIIDEVLAVGDFAFQKKCLNKMREVSRRGQTLLFVSHNTAAVSDLCSHGVYLAEGKTVINGRISDVMAKYLASTPGRSGIAHFQRDAAAKAHVSSICLLDSEGQLAVEVDVRRTFSFRVNFQVHESLRNLEVSLRISSTDGRPIITTDLSESDHEALRADRFGYYEVIVDFPSLFLVPGSYQVQVALHQPGHEILDNRSEALSFSIEDTGTHFSKYSDYHAIGVVMRPLHWNLSQRAL